MTATLLLLGVMALAGCQSTDMAALAPEPKVDPAQKECMARAMYFESNRSSDEGMLAVGTVVMNRVNSGQYPQSVCEVVGQKNQFAQGVLTRKMTEDKARAERNAERVLVGERHALVGDAMFFHTAGLTFGYPNMNYVAIAGGNAFYEKVSRELRSGKRLRSQSEARKRQTAHVAANGASALVARQQECHQTTSNAHSKLAQLSGQQGCGEILVGNRTQEPVDSQTADRGDRKSVV